MIAAFCIGEETQKFFCRIVISKSLLYRCARKISRFARNDDTGQPSTRRDERECEIARPPVSSSKAEPRDLNVIAAFCIGEETQNFFAVSLSHNLRFTGVQGRFLASLEMTIWGGKNDDTGGMMGCGGAVFSFPYPCRLAANYFPLFLRTLLSCDIMTLLGENVFTKCRVFCEFMNP